MFTMFWWFSPQVNKQVVALTVCSCLIANSWARRDRTGTSIINWHLPPSEAQTAVPPRYGHDHRVRQTELSGANVWGGDVSPPVCSLISLAHQLVPALNYLSLWGISTQGGFILMTPRGQRPLPEVRLSFSSFPSFSFAYSSALHTSKFYFRCVSWIRVRLDVSALNATKRMWRFDRFSFSRARFVGLKLESV